MSIANIKELELNAKKEQKICLVRDVLVIQKKKMLLKIEIVQIIFVLIILILQCVTNMHLLCV